MCVTPIVLDNGLIVSCRVCWQCREVYLADWTGRCIAESQDATETHLATLTYGGGDHIDSRILNYEHVRKYLKKIRNDGFKVRYFCVGEYGSAKGRAHWHLLLFWQGKVPKYKMNWSEDQEFWPHGHSKYELGDAGAARYVMKYMTKDFSDPEYVGEYGMSSHPMLGYRWFARFAQKHVDQGLAPQTKLYWFQDVLKKDGYAKEFHMSRNVWMYFCETYLRVWATRFPGKHRPSSPMLDEYEDLVAKRDAPVELRRDASFIPPGKPWLCPVNGHRYRDGDIETPVGWSETLRHWFYPVFPQPGILPVFWSFDENGERAWQSVIRTEAWAERRRAVLELQSASGKSYLTESRGS